MPLEGSLSELNLTNIIQVNCNEMNTATVCLVREDKEGVICFSNGAIVHAAVEDLVGEEAVYELLSWPDGSFVVEQGQVAPQRTISTNWNSLLLEGIRRMDEEAAQMWESVEVEPIGQPANGADEMTTLARQLKTISGVEGSVLISHDGVVFASEIDGNPEKEGAVAVFVGNAAKEVGESMKLSAFDWGLITMGSDRMLVIEQPTFFVGLALGQKASPALVSAEAAKILEQ
jgi:predicted regulator of Ras-like GTPase activity (Roadblock/LC7/MglB family)